MNLVIQLVAAMLLALALNMKLKGRSVYRTLILVPWAVPHAIAAMTFTFLYNANVGIINILAVKLGAITESISWLGNIGSAFWCVVLVAIWKGIPFQMIFILAALQGIPGDVYESAEIDGASRFQRLRYIDVPAILPTASIMLVLAVGNIMNVGYEKVLLMQNDLNLNYSEIVSTYVYKVGLASGITDFSLSTAIGMFNSVINFILLIIANWGSKKLNGSGIF